MSTRLYHFFVIFCPPYFFSFSYTILGDMLMIFFSAFVASLDGFFIGLSLKFGNITLRKQDILFFLIGNLMIYSLFLFSYSFFQFHFFTDYISFLLYLFLAYLYFFDTKETPSFTNHSLSISTFFLLLVSHSIDGTLVALSNVYDYSVWFLVFLFSFMSLFILLVGYYFGSLFPNFKHSNWICAILFLLLALETLIL